jgi:hypothetical protein
VTFAPPFIFRHRQLDVDALDAMVAEKAQNKKAEKDAEMAEGA